MANHDDISFSSELTLDEKNRLLAICGINPLCTCGAKLLRFQWYEIDPRYKYWYCLECDKAGRTPFLRAQFRGEWM